MSLNTPFSSIIRAIMWIAVGMLVIVLFHIGGTIALRVGQFSPLTGALIGGCLALFSVTSSTRKQERVEPWLKNERLGWILIGWGVIMWTFGESFWRYYISIGQSPFPSIADIGYISFPILVFAGLLLQPPSGTGRRRLLLLLDSLISMGSILAIAWYLLLGSLAQAPGEANFAKFLGLYYPITDTALLSCVMILLLRGQGRPYQATARRVSLLVVGAGLCFFVFSDFLFNVQQNAGTYVEATWIDLGWPFGLMILGIGAYLRRFLPATPPEVIEQRMQQRTDQVSFGPTQLIPYVLLSILLCVLTLNIFSTESGQIAIRPVLLLATLGVVALVVVRQVLTLRDNVRLTERQAEALKDLATANRQIEDQSRTIAQHNEELEQGIRHLKDVQASLANGNLHARAHLSRGALLPLGSSLNLMADRLIRLWKTNAYAQHLAIGLRDLSIALENHWNGTPLVIPDSCKDVVEITRLLHSLHIKGYSVLPRTPTQPLVPPGRPFPGLTLPQREGAIPIQSQTPASVQQKWQRPPSPVVLQYPDPSVKK